MMERLRNGIQRAVYRLRTDRRRRVLFISGLIGLSIITAVLEMLNGGTSSLNISKMKRGRMNAPVWNIISRQENLNNKF